MVTALFKWMRVPIVAAKCQSALIISGLAAYVAAYHYLHIFNSWNEAYVYTLKSKDPHLTGAPFNDAYCYMDWLLSVPLLRMEIVLVIS